MYLISYLLNISKFSEDVYQYVMKLDFAMYFSNNLKIYINIKTIIISKLRTF